MFQIVLLDVSLSLFLETRTLGTKTLLGNERKNREVMIG